MTTILYLFWDGFSQQSAVVADPDFTVTLPISTNPSLALTIDTSHERSLNISRSASMTLER